MELKTLIEYLRREPEDKIIREGFHKPHSYRGYYDQLAFQPLENARVGDMLAAAESCIGRVFFGYKGGEYTMNKNSDCWISEYGRTGDELSERLLRYMLADEVTP